MHASLFGIYLFMTRQVKADFKHWVKAIVFLLSLITFGVFLNYVFHKRFFGMNPYGSYSIYFLDIFHSFPLTLFAYYMGVVLVLTLGLQLGVILEYLTGIRKTSLKTGKLLKEGELEAEKTFEIPRACAYDTIMNKAKTDVESGEGEEK